jgi:hypothetical protein
MKARKLLILHFVNKPEDLTNNLLNNIGREYQIRYGEKPKNAFTAFFHDNHQHANELYTYNKTSSYDAKWHMLADIYSEIRNHRGAIATTILDLFYHGFKVQIRLNEQKENHVAPLSNREVAHDLRTIINQYVYEKNTEELARQFHRPKGRNS